VKPQKGGENLFDGVKANFYKGLMDCSQGGDHWYFGCLTFIRETIGEKIKKGVFF